MENDSTINVNVFKTPEFVNKVIKQGNSLCVRIPKSVVKAVNLKTGDDVAITLHKIDYDNLQLYYEQNFVKEINEVPQLKKYSQTKKELYAKICFDILKKSRDPDPKVEQKNRKKVALELQKEFGKEFFDDYIKFADLINKYGPSKEEEGGFVQKKTL
jgi:antitoxin component of MazEF toxin-antitoxin module